MRARVRIGRWAPVILAALLPAAMLSIASEPEKEAPAAPQAEPAGGAETTSCDRELGQRVFGQCAICHSLEEGASSIAGPNLHGVVGRVAGSAPGFAYSRAMRDFGKRWTPEELDRFLAQPMTHVPGTSMAFAGLRKPEERAAVICLLAGATDG